MEDDIQAIWSEVLSGDSGAWRKLVTRYTSMVLSVARRSGLEQADAEDCAQQTWVSLYRGRHTIKEPGRIASWLTRVAQRTVVRMRKESSRDVRRAGQVRMDDTPKLPDEELLESERDLQLELALGKLEPRCQKLLRAFFYSRNDRSYHEVAEELTMTPNSLGPTRMRCLRKLKRILIRSGYPWAPLP